MNYLGGASWTKLKLEFKEYPQWIIWDEIWLLVIIYIYTVDHKPLTQWDAHPWMVETL